MPHEDRGEKVRKEDTVPSGFHGRLRWLSCGRLPVRQKVFPDDHSSRGVLGRKESLDKALRYLRQRYHDFQITEARSVGMVALLSGSPLD